MLRDGTPVLLWPLLANDRAALAQGYLSLSSQSRYHRFLSAPPVLSDHMLDVLVGTVDGVDHVALVMLALPDTADERVIAVGRLIRYKQQPDAADVAVTVSDDWQGRGAAGVLLDTLLLHRPPGLRRLVTYVARDNMPALRMLQRLGPTTLVPSTPGVVEVTVELPTES
jgi:RimJ/RimL family protein N-acetyltransferase